MARIEGNNLVLETEENQALLEAIKADLNKRTRKKTRKK